MAVIRPTLDLIMRTRALIALVAGLLMSVAVYPQTVQSAEPVFRLDVRLVQVDAQVLNKKTRHVTPLLKQEDFQVFEDDAPQKISYFSQDKLPLSIVILFDLTDSVRPVLKSLADGALEALQHLKPEDEVAVMVYAASTQVLQEFTTDRALAVAAIEKASRMQSDEAAFFNEGIFRATEQLIKSKNSTTRRVIIWLTDDVPNIPSETEIPLRYRRSLKGAMPHSQKDALEQLLRTGTVVCSLVKGSEKSIEGQQGLMAHSAERMLHPPGEVHRYATATGGQVIEYKKKELNEKLAALIDDLRMRYSLGYRPSAQKPKGKFCTIKVKLVPEVKRSAGDVIVEARQGYYR
ncbi:MAG TPA: VWA domain-containing protein [Candidatus Sulfotelmatobacter sp.]|nr:VWA domain-containing protein [Candidatus Sulfotelmatobacter sp.]